MIPNWIILVLFMVFVAEKAYGTVCSYVTVTNTSTYIDSHGTYGVSHYPNNYERCWILMTEDSSMVVGITTVDFDVEKRQGCNNDKLTIYNSNTQTKTGKSVYFCGKKGEDIFTNLYSSSRYMYLLFTTNAEIAKDGFRFNVMQYDKSMYDPDLWESTSAPKGINGGEIAGIVIGSLFVSFVAFSCINNKRKEYAVKKKANTQSQARQNQTSPSTSSASSASAASASNTTKPKPSVTKPKPASTVLTVTSTSSTHPSQTTTQSACVSNAVSLPSSPPPGVQPPAYNDLFTTTNVLADPFGVPIPPMYYPRSDDKK